MAVEKKDRARRIFQGIDDADALKLRVNTKGATGDAGKTALAKTFGNRFRIPIDFELLNDIGPYHQASLADKLEIKLTFNDAGAVILVSTATLTAVTDRDYGYSVSYIRTEWDQITSPSLASSMRGVYQTKVGPSVYARIRAQIHEYQQVRSCGEFVGKRAFKEFVKNIDISRGPRRSKGVFAYEKFKNLDITKVNIGIEGVEKVNALYASEMQKENTYDQILKMFGENGVTLRDFLTEKYALCIDLRPSTDWSLHGNGANLQNTSEGVTLEIHRVAGGGVGKLNLNVFLFQDCQLNISGGRFHSIKA